MMPGRPRFRHPGSKALVAAHLTTYDSVRKMAAGEDVEVKGFRRRGMQWMLISVAELLGTNGTIALGVALLVLIVGRAATRIIRRPERTVWLPVNAPAGPAGVSSS
jgi:hypothetical protein